MAQPWVCPACTTVIDSRDYEQARLGLAYVCRKCGLGLIVDRKLGIPVLADKPAS